MKKRLFFSIPLSEDILDQLIKSVSLIKFNNARWISAENWHVTVLFMGDVQDTLIPEIITESEEIFKKIKPFDFKFKKIVFIPQNNARMIWAEYEKNEVFNELCQAIYKKLKRFILDDSANQYKEIIPHITLARLVNNNKQNLPLLIQPRVNKLQVDKINLIESQLTLQGSIYTRICEFNLNVL